MKSSSGTCIEKYFNDMFGRSRMSDRLSQNVNFVSKFPSSIAATSKLRFRDHVSPIFKPTPISDPGPQSSLASTWSYKHCREYNLTIHIHSYLQPVSDQISLKQSNEQVDDMFYLLMAPFSWHMVWLGGSTASVYGSCLQLVGLWVGRAMTWPRAVSWRPKVILS